MIKNLTCIECPKGCHLTVEIEGGQAIKVSGNQCPKGEKYAVSEVENPVRTLTSSVLAEGLALKMVPVRTDQPIPRDRVFEAMAAIKRLRLKGPVRVGEVVVANFLNLGVNLVVIRDAAQARPEGKTSSSSQKRFFVWLISGVLAVAAGTFTCQGVSAERLGVFENIPGPTLLSPTTDNIDLSGIDLLEFRWMKRRLPETDRFEFRLYKGYQTTADNVILKQDFSAYPFLIKIPVAQFDRDQVYSWSLRQVFDGGDRSDRSFASFKVIRK